MTDDSKSPLKKWRVADKKLWLKEQLIKRSYINDVVSRLKTLKSDLLVVKYGALSYNIEKYPLFIVKSKNWSKSKPTILITGGVHGYETSGVHGALGFLETIGNFKDSFNFAVVPCVSPWGYETINRWNPNTLDPNRCFYQDSPAEESAALMDVVANLQGDVFAHFDLHETTDTDNTVFRPALAARDGIEQDNWNIPDGFYTVGDSENPVPAFQKAIITSVKKVTHIAPPDSSGRLIGELMTQEGVINYPVKKYCLCTGFSNSKYSTTTEVYPDSLNSTPEECVLAQIAAISGGLNYLMENTLT
ncbi:MAG: peptidase [Gammaproteobacteria bacterium]|nr:MAG: peptidase [Gammaproteobacteria bacterium]